MLPNEAGVVWVASVSNLAGPVWAGFEFHGKGPRSWERTVMTSSVHLDLACLHPSSQEARIACLLEDAATGRGQFAACSLVSWLAVVQLPWVSTVEGLWIGPPGNRGCAWASMLWYPTPNPKCRAALD